MDIGYIGIDKISVKIHGYWPNIGEISAKMPENIGKMPDNIEKNIAKMK